jgi:hypothetical protein
MPESLRQKLDRHLRLSRPLGGTWWRRWWLLVALSPVAVLLVASAAVYGVRGQFSQLPVEIGLTVILVGVGLYRARSGRG